MLDIIYLALTGVAGLAIGVIITSTILRKAVEKKSEKLLQEAKEKAEVFKKDKILQAKEKFLQLKTEHEKAINEKNAVIQQTENRLKQKESSINQKLEEHQRKQKEVDSIRTNLNNQLEILGKKQQDLEKAYNQQVEQLETISGLSASEAKEQLKETILEEARSDAQVYISEIVDEAKLTANQKAKKIVIESIQRTAVEHAIENTVSVFHLDNDEIKGRIIGREGRNIRALESLTGIEINWKLWISRLVSR